MNGQVLTKIKVKQMFNKAVIDFFLNTSNAKKQLNNLSDSFTKAKESFGLKMTSLAGGLFGWSAIKEVYQQTKKLADFSEKFSLPVEKVSKFNNVLSLFGGSSDTAIEGLQNIEQAITDLRTTGSGALKTVASQVGLSMYNMDGSIKNSLQIMEDLRRKFKGLNQDAQLKVAQELGLSDPAMLRMLRASDKEYKEMTEQAKKMSVVDKKNAETVQRVSRLLASMKQSLFSVGATLLEYVEPVLKVVAEYFEKFNGLSDSSKKIIVGLGVAFVGLSPALSIISGIGGGLGSLIGIAKSLTMLFGGLGLKIGLVAGALYGAYEIGSKFAEWYNEKFTKNVMGEDYEKSQLEEINQRRKKAGKEEITWEAYKQNKEEKGFMLPTSSQISNEANATTNNTTTSSISKPATNQTFNFTLNTNGSVQENKNMIMQVIQQQASGVR